MVSLYSGTIHYDIPVFSAHSLWYPSIQGPFIMISQSSGLIHYDIPVFRDHSLWYPSIQGPFIMVSQYSGNIQYGIPVFRDHSLWYLSVQGPFIELVYLVPGTMVPFVTGDNSISQHFKLVVIVILSYIHYIYDNIFL